MLLIRHSLPLDISASSYIFAGLLFFYLLYFLFNKKIYFIVVFYCAVILLILVLISIIDKELFMVWQSKINSDFYRFLHNPKEATASIANVSKLFPIMLLLLSCALLLWIWNRWIIKRIKNIYIQKWVLIIVFFILQAINFLGVRGSIGTSPISSSAAFFSNNNTQNYISLNGLWNALYYAFEDDAYLEESMFKTITATDSNNVKKFYFDSDTTQIITSISNPNIILITIESGSANFSKLFSHNYNSMPLLDNWLKKGIYFTQCYSPNDRTDKGLATILSGWPGNPNFSILKNFSKLKSLESIIKKANEKNYQTGFLYGGDLNFANIGAFIHTMGFDNVLDEKQIAGNFKGKWGFHDEYGFSKLLEVINQSPKNKPFFWQFLTLSNHEPFDVPKKFIPIKKDIDNSLSAAVYTDNAINDFLTKASKQNWFNNTIFIFVADHGRFLPLENCKSPNAKPFHHIIFGIFGKPLNPNITGECKTTVSQADLAETINCSIFGNKPSFEFSKNIFAKNYQAGALVFLQQRVGFINNNNNAIFFNNNGFTVGDESDKFKGDTSCLSNALWLQKTIVRRFNKLSGYK